jgi:hypothetical protein
MSADKHTPGPWRVAPGDACLVFNGHHVKPTKAPNAADALLIAAAPDLLAALEFAADKLDDAIRLAGCTAGSYKRARDEARAIIAKARGEQ